MCIWGEKNHNTITCIVHTACVCVCVLEYECMPNGILCQSYKNKSIQFARGIYLIYFRYGGEEKWKKTYDCNSSYSKIKQK